MQHYKTIKHKLDKVVEMVFRVIAIPETVSNEVRSTLRSPSYGHPAHVEMATGYGPCRSCLQTFEENKEERILFTHQPFEGLSPLPLPAPIFIHKDDCTRYEENNGFPPELRNVPMLFESFGQGTAPLTHEPVIWEEVEYDIERLFSNPIVRYLIVRNAEAGCYIARIERAPVTDTSPLTSHPPA